MVRNSRSSVRICAECTLVSLASVRKSSWSHLTGYYLHLVDLIGSKWSLVEFHPFPFHRLLLNLRCNS